MDVGSDGIRVAEMDRAAAGRLLGDHLVAGRLTSEDHAERAAHAAAARTRGDLLALFADLPQPHPQFDVPTQALVADAPGQQASEMTSEHGERPALSRRTHMRYALIAVIGPCAVFGAGAGLLLGMEEPAGLALALVAMVAIYGILVVGGKLRR